MDLTNLDINELTTLLNQLFVSMNNTDAVMYDIFFNTTPMDVILKRYDENGVLQSYTIPNRAKDTQQTLKGTTPPNGVQIANIGVFYLDVSSYSIYYKASGSDAFGWVKIFSSANFIAGTDYVAPDGDGSLLTNLNGSSISSGYVPIKNGGTGVGTLVEAGAELAPYILPAGIILPFAGSTIPTGYLACDGASYSRTTYSNLFNAIGTSYSYTTQYWKRNVSIAGSPTLTSNTIYNNFSTNNYLLLNSTFSPLSSSWEMNLKFTTGTDIGTTQSFCGHLSSIYSPVVIGIISGKFIVSLHSSNSSAGVIASNSTGTYTVLANTTYYTRVAYNGSSYTFSYSLDGNTYSNDITINSTVPIYADKLILGRETGSSSNYPFLGSLDLSGCNIKINGTTWWKGIIEANFIRYDFYTTESLSDLTFCVPDCRGIFLRGLDDNVGIDSNRQLGSLQASGAPNITGSLSFVPGWTWLAASGAFQNYSSGYSNRAGDGGTAIYVQNPTFDASRSSSVYQNGLTEVRPSNIAINYIIKY